MRGELFWAERTTCSRGEGGRKQGERGEEGVVQVELPNEFGFYIESNEKPFSSGE